MSRSTIMEEAVNEESSYVFKAFWKIMHPDYFNRLKRSLFAQAKAIHGIENDSNKVQHSAKHVPLQLSVKDQISYRSHGLKDDISEKLHHPIISPCPLFSDHIHSIFSNARRFTEKNVYSQQSPESREQFIDRNSNCIALIGEAGIGKSALTRMVIQQITEKKIFPECQFIFFIQFQDIDFGPKISFLQLGLTGSNVSWKHLPWLDREVLQKLGDGSKVAMVIEDLNEIDTTVFTTCDPLPNPGGLATADVHIKHILLGKLLPKAKKLITSRPRQFLDLHPDLRQLFVVEILGLDKEDKMKLCQQICQSDEIYSKVREILKCHPEISSLLYVPRLCISISSFLSRLITNGDLKYIPTLARIYVKTLSCFDNIEHLGGKDGDLVKLTKLAWRGFLNDQVNFTEEELKDSGIKPKLLQDFLVTFVGDKSQLKGIIAESSKKTKFSQFIWQELFSAIHAAMFMSVDQFEEILSKLVESRWKVVSKFIFGLFNKDVQKLATNIFGIAEFFDEDAKKFKLMELCSKFVKDLRPSLNDIQPDTGKLMLVSSWLYELNDEDDAKDVFVNFPDQIKLQAKITSYDVTSIAFMYSLSKQPAQLSANDKDDIFIPDRMKPFLHLSKGDTTKVLDLRNVHVGESVASNIIQCLQHVDQILLTSYRISLDGMEKREDVTLSCETSIEEVKSLIYHIDPEVEGISFCNWFNWKRTETVSLTDVLLKICWHQVDHLEESFRELKTEHLKILTSVIAQSPQQLKNLDLKYSKIGNIGMKELASCVENIERLYSTFGDVTVVDGLCANIRTLKQPLKVLDLSRNKIGNIGMKELASCVENIEELRLYNCDITEVDDLCAKIRTLQQPLKVLDLSGNEIGNIGMKELASCAENIQELRLKECGITEVDDLCAKIRTLQQPLKVLSLSVNKIGNIGMKEIASCVENIEELLLNECEITEVDELSAKIQTLQKPMKVLSIEENKIGEDGAWTMYRCVRNVETMGLLNCGVFHACQMEIRDRLMEDRIPHRVTFIAPWSYRGSY